MPKTTPEQSFANYFNMANDEAAAQNERDKAEKAMAAWLRRHKKTRRDIGAILLQAAKDEEKANPPPPPPDPRAGTPHTYGGRKFSPADVVEHVVKRYVTMDEHVAVISTLWAIFTHVYPRFAIAPRLVLTSEEPDSTKP